MIDFKIEMITNDDFQQLAGRVKAAGVYLKHDSYPNSKLLMEMLGLYDDEETKEDETE